MPANFAKNLASEKIDANAIASPYLSTKERKSEFRPLLRSQIDPPDLPSQRPIPEQNLLLPSPSDLLDLQLLTPEDRNNTDIPGTIIVKRFEVRGSTIFSPEDFAELTKNYINRPIFFRELLHVRSLINEEYEKRDYITSGAFIPQQEITNGTIIIQVIEGEIEAINITGARRLNPEYIRSRLGLFVRKPLNIKRLQEGLYLLQRDPLIASLASELSAGTRTGQNILDVVVKETKTFNYSILLNNNRSPVVGSFRRGIGATEANLFGWGDRISLFYNNTDGSNSIDLSYSMPYSPTNGNFRYSYGNNSSQIIDPDFAVFQVESDSEYHEFNLRQPLYQTLAEELAIGLIYSYQSTQSRIGLFDLPLSSRGTDINGSTRVSALRFFQEWTKRNSDAVFSVRSQFSLGTNWFNPTDNDTLPDSAFFSWRGQVQWIKRIEPDILFILRGDIQFSDRPLLALEQFGIGGQKSVRGYGQDLIVADNGIFASAEARIPIFRVSDGVLQIAPFIDFGMGWNNDNIEIDPNALTSVGMGLRWQQGNNLTIRLDWGIPLTNLNASGNTLQENGIYFSILYNLFP
ncbi:MAG: ShlB/FhaC/HecB family hemolysin secretion/activation protein [Cyanobacteria bacterium SBLK]|nr:ShlB/FhaC/HecB family hemolysin secretion/activation protein [Cyanobacteria bacterium SBLK]